MITQDEMRQLFERKIIPKSSVLSIYCNRRTAGQLLPQDRLEIITKSSLQSLEKTVKKDQMKDFKKEALRIEKFISQYQISGQGLVIFSDDSENFFWAKEIRIEIPSQAYWLERPYLLPLFEVFDEYERYGIILADRKRARIFTYLLGNIEEEKDVLATNSIRHFRTTGKDNLRSAFKLQRTAQMHEQWHLKHVVELITEMSVHHPFDRLILGGTKQTTEKLYDLLPYQFQLKVSGRLPFSVDLPEKERHRILTKFIYQIEREEEMRFIQTFLQTDPTNPHRILGLDAVLFHLNKGLIHTLVYSDKFNPSGCQCAGCGYLFGEGRTMCGRCGSSIKTLPYLLEEMVRRTLLAGGSIEGLKGEAAQKLKNSGEIGAILK